MYSEGKLAVIKDGALLNSIVQIILVIGPPPKAVVLTFSIRVHHPKSIVQEIEINSHPVKTTFMRIRFNRQPPISFVWTIPTTWKHQTSILQAIPIHRRPVKTIFRTTLVDRQSSGSFVCPIRIDWKHQTSIVQPIAISGQSPQSIVRTIPNHRDPKIIARTMPIILKYQHELLQQFQLMHSPRRQFSEQIQLRVSEINFLYKFHCETAHDISFPDNSE